MDIAAISAHLEEQTDGLWVVARHTDIPYPEIGNVQSLAIEEHSFWFRHRNRCILEVLRRFPPPGAIFDVGGGNGFVSRAICGAGYDAVVVEPGIAGAQAARARGLTPVICATLEEAGFDDHALPAIGLFDVFEHIEHDAAFLATCRRLLVRGGRVYLTTPAYEWLWSYEDDYARHQHRYTTRSLERTLNRAGFAIEFASYFFVPLPLPIFLFRTLPTRFGWRRRWDADVAKKEHATGIGAIGRALDAVLGAELTFLRRALPLPFGASCLVVARPG